MVGVYARWRHLHAERTGELRNSYGLFSQLKALLVYLEHVLNTV